MIYLEVRIKLATILIEVFPIILSNHFSIKKLILPVNRSQIPIHYFIIHIIYFQLNTVLQILSRNQELLIFRVNLN